MVLDDSRIEEMKGLGGPYGKPFGAPFFSESPTKSLRVFAWKLNH